MNKKVHICDVPVNNLGYSEVIERVKKFIEEKRKVYFVTVNPEMVVNASFDDEFCSALKSAEIITPDGVGILWSSSYLESPQKKNKISQFFQLIGSLLKIPFRPKSIRTVLKQRVTGVDLFKKIVNEAQENDWKIFLLGASKGVADRVIKKFERTHAKTKFVGCFAGTPKEEGEDEICDKINESGPDILFVAYGSPDQEFWIHRNLFKLDSVKVAIGVGGAFDFWSGKVKRAPKFLRRIGLEWLWRLAREPKRFFRIWNATVKFIRLIYQEKNQIK